MSAVPWAMVSCMVLVCALEIAIWSSPLAIQAIYEATGPAECWDVLRTSSQVENLKKRPGNPSIILAGSSQVRDGFDPEIIQAAFPGFNCLNLGISAGRPSDAMFLLESLDGMQDPPTVIIGLSPCMLSELPQSDFIGRHSLHLLIQTGLWREMSVQEILFMQCMGVSKTLRSTMQSHVDVGNWYEFIEVILGIAPPTPKFRGLDLPEWDDAYLDRRLKLFNDEVRLDEASFIPTPAFLDFQWKSLEFIATRQKLMRKPLIIVPMPGWRNYAGRIHADYLPLCEKWQAELSEKYGARIWDSSKEMAFNHQDFYDLDHLNERGRKKLTRWLAERIKNEGR